MIIIWKEIETAIESGHFATLGKGDFRACTGLDGLVGLVRDISASLRNNKGLGILGFLDKASSKSLTRRSRNQRWLDKRLTTKRNRLLLISIQLIRSTAISLPTIFRGREIACSVT